MTLGDIVGFVMLVSLTLYALGGGADFGGGVWDLLARGPRAKEQRELIARAIGPIWEANHVWLILVVVLLFVAFPIAFSTISIALHIPLTLMLIGIVLRGSAFAFRSYDVQTDDVQRRWSRMFAAGSIIAPLMLGVCVGAIASGSIRVDLETGRVQTNFFSQWLAPFPFAIGILTLALFALLAAVYLTVETTDPGLKEDFRARALWAGVAVGIAALLAFLLSGTGAPLIRAGLARAWWSIPFQVLTGLVALGALAALWTRRYAAARVLAMAQTILIIWGWGFAQFPYIVEPDLTFANSAAPATVLRMLLVALAAGTIVLFPSLWYLFRVFKTRA
ncbi:MAG TPA: cytochrome d ubiquinol oxidase subunit II [Verrucomicrobia bacterium]|nr:cytochrome d ubiquinol oxidase subunit II [Verrucomicrobiota bacterium]HOP97524.1 cytochrome d ubiquinol oxidase subunit II [Verrucomicrobiota bacterium]HPU56611.1 cytochrome d ubiquinol oxidase subunit II [Verrucomicrobiota bacterium]